MRVKHWSGYGCVEAINLGKSRYCHTILVKGNHEQGLEPRYFDLQDWFRWLGKRCRVDEYRFNKVECQTWYEREKDHDVEVMEVTFWREA